jgi:hypothetical protein
MQGVVTYGWLAGLIDLSLPPANSRLSYLTAALSKPSKTGLLLLIGRPI